jgi:TRIAD3 protein (E3 ubiquitin-protein ligase RNF216)
MPPLRYGPVIEIESSPEPYPNVRTTQSTSRARSVGPKANAASEAKKRAKRPKALIVIELTDSEPDVMDDVSKKVMHRRETSPVAGPSNGAERKSMLINHRLFFPSDDDEENVPVGDLVREIQNIPVEELSLPAPMELDDPLPPLPPPQEEPIDPIFHTLVQILEIIPDIDPEHALGLVQEHLPAFVDLDDNSHAVTWKEYTMRAAEHVIELVLEAPKTVTKKGKARAVKVQKRKSKRHKIDYESIERVFMGGKDYFELALVCTFSFASLFSSKSYSNPFSFQIHLQISFPHIPKEHIRRVLLFHNSFYAPTHLAIAENEKLVRDEMALLGSPLPTSSADFLIKLMPNLFIFSVPRNPSHSLQTHPATRIFRKKYQI